MATDVQSETASREGQPVWALNQTPVKKRPARGRSGWKQGVFVAALIIAAAAYFTVGAVSPEQSTSELTQEIVRRDLEVTVTEEGTLESSNNTEVRCKVKGANSTIVWIIENGTEVEQGDDLVRLDTSTIEDNITTQEISYQNALATYAQSESDVAVAEINLTEYVEGTFRSELKTKEKDVAIARANLTSAQNMLKHAQDMFRKGYMSQLELEGNQYSLQQAELELEVKEVDVDVLMRYTKAKQVQDLTGILEAKKAKLASDKAALDLEKAKLDREKQQLENCVIKAKAAGMVIYAEGDKYGDRPEIREGGTVREDQVLLLIPDLEDMQVRIRVHEARIDEVKPGLPARVQLQESTYSGEVVSVKSMAERAGWWNGNMVKYETIIKLDTKAKLKPGMSASAEIILAEHTDAITIPVAAVVEKEDRYFCWVRSGGGAQKRQLDLGDSDDQFLVVNSGVKDGDEVVINPLAYIEEAQAEALTPFSGVKSSAAAEDGESNKPVDGKPEPGPKKSKPEPQADKPTKTDT